MSDYTLILKYQVIGVAELRWTENLAEMHAQDQGKGIDIPRSW